MDNEDNVPPGVENQNVVYILTKDRIKRIPEFISMLQKFSGRLEDIIHAC